MIDGSARLIIIIGMMHSGTTILTHLLSQHPDLRCEADDGRHLETSLLRKRDSVGIEALLQTGDRILLKMPQKTLGNLRWLAGEFPDAHYVYMWKSLPDMELSWSRLAAEWIPDAGPDYYQAQMAEAAEMETRVPHLRRIAYADLLAEPGPVLLGLTSWLGIAKYEYETSVVRSDVSIKDVLGRDLIPTARELIP